MLAKKIFILIIFFLLQPCFAEDLPNLTTFQNTKLQDNILLLEIIKANSIGKKDQLSTIKKELPVYESLVELTCMPNLTRTFEYTDYNPETPEGKLCEEYIKKLEEILPSDPVLLCAKNGINSQICKDGYNAQYIGTFDPDEYDKEAIDIKSKLNLEMSKSEIESLKNSIDQKKASLDDEDKLIERLKKDFPVDEKRIETLTKKQETTKLEIEDLYIKVVNLECSLTQISIVSDKAPDSSMLIKQQNPQKTSSKLEKLISKLTERNESSRADSELKKAKDYEKDLYLNPFEETAETTPTPTPSPTPKFWRIRQITRDCNSAVEKALEYSPNLYAAVCKKYGETSPQCIQSMRDYKVKRLKVLNPSGTAQQADGLATF